jgi:undecaprenyl-diphosphatase
LRFSPFPPFSRSLTFAAAVFLTLIIGFSRVYLGVHWPIDVAAGWCVGAAYTPEDLL